MQKKSRIHSIDLFSGQTAQIINAWMQPDLIQQGKSNLPFSNPVSNFQYGQIAKHFYVYSLRKGPTDLSAFDEKQHCCMNNLGPNICEHTFLLLKGCKQKTFQTLKFFPEMAGRVNSFFILQTPFEGMFNNQIMIKNIPY